MSNYNQLYLRILKFKNFIERSEFELLKAHGLKRNDSLVLMAMDGKESTLGELCSVCCIDKSTMTKVIKNLYANGYVEKSDANRNIRVRLTEKGKRIVEATFNAFVKLNNSATEFLTVDEISTLNSLFDKLLSVSEDKYISEIKHRVK